MSAALSDLAMVAYLLYAAPGEGDPARGEWLRYRSAWVACALGEEPAESLPRCLRAHLFHTMLRYGWSVTDIGAWTRTTPYTVRRCVGRD